jgi:2-dehydro-3-deoxygalactonokinase
MEGAVKTDTEWVAVDWGTSNVRAWGVAADGTETFAAQSDRGMGKIAAGDYPAVLDELIAGRAVPGAEVLVCGMAGARQGWREAPYLDVPAALDSLAAGAVVPPGSRYAPRILPGLCQRQPGHEDVMRGEETQLLGLTGLQPGFEGAAILPGTHSKWVEIAGGRIRRFSTAMTGELYEVLSQHSVLRHSFTGEIEGSAIEDGIAEGMRAGIESPALATSLVFRTRAAALVAGKGADWCSGYLSGLLVGVEVGGHRDWLSGAPVPLIGSARFGQLYGAALALIGIEGQPLDAGAATLAGLKEARAQQ